MKLHFVALRLPLFFTAGKKIMDFAISSRRKFLNFLSLPEIQRKQWCGINAFKRAINHAIAKNCIDRSSTSPGTTVVIFRMGKTPLFFNSRINVLMNVTEAEDCLNRLRFGKKAKSISEIM